MALFFSNHRIFAKKNHSKPILRAIELLLFVAIFIVNSTSTAQAAIVWSGDVSPNDPATWTSTTPGYLGTSTDGTVWIDGGSIVNSSILYIGYQASGTLDIGAGGRVNCGGGYLGYGVGSNGSATIHGSDARWILRGSEFYIGLYGTGTLNIEAGGQVSSGGSSNASNLRSSSYLGYYAGATGSANVAGVGSQWTTIGDLYVGYYGNGTLTVDDGGSVIVNQCLFASLDSLLGNGTISANGAVLDADMVFDAAHGSQPTIAFGTGGSLILNQSSSGALGAGYKGNGTLRIADGTVVASTGGYLGRFSGSNGTATVTGAGSNWTNSGTIYVGYYGNGTLNIEEGGQVSNSDCFLGLMTGTTGLANVTGTGSQWNITGNLYVGREGSGALTVADGGTVTISKVLFASFNSLQGNGTISANGVVLDADLVFDANHGVQQTLAFGTGGSLNLKQNSSNPLGVGYKGNGTLKIADGITVSSSDGYLGYYGGSTGTATVTGAGSKWTNSGVLNVGYYGTGTLTISGGGQVSNTNGHLGILTGSTGTAVVTGANSKWTTNDSLYIHNGTLTVADGGTVTIIKSLFASWDNLKGNGTISCAGAVLDGDLLFDATHGLQQAFSFGTGGTLSLNQNANGTLGTGYNGTGTLRIADGITVSSFSGYLGYNSGSSGTATVTGAGSKWTDGGSLYVGNSGNGTLTIEAGGQVSNTSGYLGANTGAIGSVTVTGANSKWINSSVLNIYHNGSTLNIRDGGQVTCSNGNLGGGTATVSGAGSSWINSSQLHVESMLNIEAGGQVSDSGCYVGTYANLSGTVKVTGAGSTWTNSTNLYIGNSGNGTLSIEAGGQVSNTSDGYLGYDTSSIGMVNVTGSGSKWTNGSNLYVGYRGSGSLTVSDGGVVSVTSCLFASLNDLHGDGTISTNGIVMDSNLVFDATHGLKQTIAFGSGGSLNLNQTASGVLGVGYNGNGSLRVADGLFVTSSYGYLGYISGSDGTATIHGIGSKWSNTAIYIGYSGMGTLSIDEGGIVDSYHGTPSSYLGYNTGSYGTATVSGTGSLWTCSTLFVGYKGGGNLTVKDGGTVTVKHTLYASLNSLMGNGTISTNGAVLDADLLFDSTQGSKTTIHFGTGGSLNVTPTSSFAALGAGYKSIGSLKIADGITVYSSEGDIGYNSGSSGTALVTGVGTTWSPSTLYVGKSGSGILNINGSGKVITSGGYLGYNSSSNGTVTVSGAGSMWDNHYELDVGYSGNGALVIEAGGQVNHSTLSVYLGYNSGSSGTVRVTGAGSMLTSNRDIYVGYYGNGMLNIESGGQVSSNGGSIGTAANGLSGAVTVTGSGSKWINSSSLGIASSGTLVIQEGGQVSNTLGFLGSSNSTSTGMVSVSGTGSKWTNNGELYIGYDGNGSLKCEAGGQVSNTKGYLGYNTGCNGTATIVGTGSQWANSQHLYVGYQGNGTLDIKDGGQVSDTFGYVGASATGSVCQVTVTGTGSKWTNSQDLRIGYNGLGILNIEAGGQVTCNYGYAGDSSAPYAVTVTGTGSKWTISQNLRIGYVNNNGEMNIATGGQVSDVNGYLKTTATVTGTDSMWTNTNTLYVGSGGNGILNIGSGIASGGLVKAGTLNLAQSSSGTCNLNGGTLQAGGITKGTGAATFNWLDGTIQNYNANSDLNINYNLTLKLAATGTHVFNIDANRMGFINAVLSDATSGGTLVKQGAGTLNLSAANTYTGSTTISAGTLILTAPLASSLIDVQSGASFYVSGISGGFSLGQGKTLQGSGTIVGNLIINGIHAPGSSLGIETVKGNYSMLGQLNIELVGTIAGTGYDQVLLPVNGTAKYNTTLGGTLNLDWASMSNSTDTTQLWILENDTTGTLTGTFSNYVNGATLGNHDGHDWYIWYGADAATGNLTGGNDVIIAAVPEPSTLAMLGLCLVGIVAQFWRWRRK